MQVNGIDVYNGNGDLDFQAVKDAGVTLLIAKATEGTYYQDQRYRRNVGGARAAGMIPGAYHFVRPQRQWTAIDEADYFLNYVDATTGVLPGMILALDYETYEGQWSLAAGSESIEYALDWLRTVDDLVGFKPYFYANLSMLANYCQWSELLAPYPLWFAGDRPDLSKFPVVLQQNGYTDINGHQYDADYFGPAWNPVKEKLQMGFIYRAVGTSTTNPAVVDGSLWIIVGQDAQGTLLVHAEDTAAAYPQTPIVPVDGELLGRISVFVPGAAPAATHGTWSVG